MENKKPSARIQELAKEINNNPNVNDLQYVEEHIQAILNYLDETWEQNQICKHEQDGVHYLSNPPQYKCKKCGEYFKE